MITPEGIDPYAVVAPVYDDLCEHLGPEWVVRLENHLARFGRSETELSLLDLGCGTGTLLIALRIRHPAWRLTGLDASAAMLAQARSKTRSGEIKWIHAKFEDAPRTGQHDIVVSFFDALNHVLSSADLDRSIEAVANALVPGGLFLFDLNNRLGCEYRSGSRANLSQHGWRLSSSDAFDPITGIETTRVSVQRHQDPPADTVILRRCFAPEEIARSLESAGLIADLCETWSFARGEPPGKTWYIARKRA